MESFKGQRIIGKVYIGKDFSGADFSGAELVNAIFRKCDFRGADFTGLKLENTRFENCLFDIIDVSDFWNIIMLAEFYRAGIRAEYRTPHEGGYYLKYFTVLPRGISCPIDTDGENLVCYKKIHVDKDYCMAYPNAVAKLEIPAYADRVVYKGDKCRASCARVLEIKDKQGNTYDVGCSAFYPDEKEYIVGHMIYASNFDDNPFEICSGGIHFFLTEEEAWRYTG